MKKRTSLFLSFIFFNSIIFGQIDHSISLGPDLSIPTESLGRANLGFGGSLQYQLKFSAPVAVQLHVGYSSFTNKVYSDQRVSFLPVRLGAVGFVYQDIFFVYADAGISQYHSKSGDPDRSGFSFGAGVGYKQSLDNGQFLQFSAYYNLNKFKRETPGYYYKYNWFNIRAAYGLLWGKGRNREG